jgi:hypothetical protein
MEPVTLDDLWMALGDEERRLAADAFWTSRADPKANEERERVQAKLAHAMNFRPQFVQRAKPLEKTKWLLARIGSTNLRNDRELLIRVWLLTHHLSVITAFLDATAVVHSQGLIADNAVAPSPELIRAALKTLMDQGPPLAVGVYLGYLCVYPGGVLNDVPGAISREAIDLRQLLGLLPPTVTPTLERTSPAPTSMETATAPKTIEADEFTTLDNLLIRQIVATAFHEFGAATVDELEDLVDEAVELNASRHRTLFHRGFLHAILDRPLVLNFPGENEARRLWYLTGVLMGLLRSGDPKRFLVLLRGQHKLVSILIARSELACGSLLLPHVYEHLLQAGELAQLCHWMRRHIARAPRLMQCRLLDDMQGDGEDLFKDGKISEASLLFDAVRDVLGSGLSLPAEFDTSLRIANTRRRAQVYQSRGNFSEAKRLFEEVANAGTPVDAARALGDRGLIEAGFRAMEPALPRAEAASNVELCAALTRGRDFFERAVTTNSGEAIKGHLCLGILGLVGVPSASASAASHFRQAYESMLRRERSYAGTGLIEWCRFCYGIALLEVLDESSLPLADDLLQQSIKSGISFPLVLWERGVRAASMFADHSLAERVCRHLLEAREQGIPTLLADTKLYERSPSLRRVYFEWLCEGQASIDHQWDGSRRILASALRAGEPELAQLAIDQLERIAVSLHSRRAEFRDLLDHPAAYSPAWDPEDAETAHVRMLELDGEFDAAAQIVMKRFYRLRQIGTPVSLAHAQQVVEQLREYKVGAVDCDRLSLLLGQESVAQPGADREGNAASVQPLSVLYIGGNETQRQYEGPIRQAFARSMPNLTLSFLFPGWTSNWHKWVEDVKRRLPHVHAVVLSSMVRTQFGRHVRALCDEAKPWFPCTGRGRQSLTLSIERAAAFLAARD